jgi:protoheme IX farnesyltransferase
MKLELPDAAPEGAQGLDARLGPLTRGRALALDLVSLTKPRISAFVVLAAFAGGVLAAGERSSALRAALAALAIGAVAASSAAFNQVLERDVDRLMRRTAGRALPSGRLGVRDAVLFATVLAIAGTCALAAWFEPPCALLALATLIAYVLVYTPLKRYSSFNTLVGAIPGAMPPLLGAVALGGQPGFWGWCLFGVVFAWQFPHFLAIAWLHREDYRRAGMKMLPALEGSEGVAGRQALLYGLVLLPLSLLPSLRGEAGIVYAAVAAAVGLVYVGAAAAFALRESRRTARATLLASLVHLPLCLAAALLDPAVLSLAVPS